MSKSTFPSICHAARDLTSVSSKCYEPDIVSSHPGTMGPHRLGHCPLFILGQTGMQDWFQKWQEFSCIRSGFTFTVGFPEVDQIFCPPICPLVCSLSCFLGHVYYSLPSYDSGGVRLIWSQPRGWGSCDDHSQHYGCGKMGLETLGPAIHGLFKIGVDEYADPEDLC